MAAIDTVYVLGGGEYMERVFHGVAAIIGSSEWDSMFRIVFLISAMTFFVVYIRGHDPKEILKFAAVSILISSVLLVPKRTVQVIDRTDPTGVYLIDNVPLGLAVPARFISSIGTSLTELYETVFHTPNSLSYSKTGMLFGADLVGNMSDIMTVNGDLAELMGMYAKNCVIGDILINHKYSFQELMNSRDPYTLIFKNPSPLRGVMVPQGNLEATPAGFWTCEKLAKEVLMPKIGIDTSPNGKTWDYTVRSIFGGRPDANVLYSAMLGDSYREYYKGSETASQLMRNSVVMNALKHGISAYSAQSGDTASLINLSSTSSYNKMRLSWATSSKVATSFVPLLNTILFSFVIALFPIFILLAVIHVLTGKMLFNYIMSIIYLQSWAPMFAILNYATSFYLSRKTGGMDFNLGNQATIQQIHSDIGLIAGWLSISIPFIAVALVRGLGPAIAQAGNYLGTAINSSATASSSQAADGTWSFNNMQTDNVTGNKWDTNYGFRDGQMTRQLASGASTTRTQDGQVVHNVQEGMSKLPVSIRGSQAISSTLQQQARHAEADAASYLQSYQHSVNSSFNQLSQFSQQRGNSTTLSKQSDSGETASASAAAMKMDSAVSSYARSKGIDKQQAYSELMDKTTRGTATAGVKGQISSPLMDITGTGVSAYADANVSGSTGSSHGTQSSSTGQQGHRQDESAQAAKDFKEGHDYLLRWSQSRGTNQHDNDANSNVDQFAATLNIADNQFQQYSNSHTKSQEYSEMASHAQNNSAQWDSIYDQQFVQYVHEKAPERAEALLTNTSDVAIGQEREQLAKSFIHERVVPAIEQDYAQNRAKIEAMGDGQGYSLGAKEADVRGNYDRDAELIGQLADNAHIRRDVPQAVSSQQQAAQQGIDEVKARVQAQQSAVAATRQTLQQSHERASKDHEAGLAAEKAAQKTLPGEPSQGKRVIMRPHITPPGASKPDKSE